MRMSIIDAWMISWALAWVSGFSFAMALMTYRKRK